MGSFTLTKKIPREDTQDDEIIEELATISGIEDLRTFLIQRCRQKLAAWPALLARKWISANFMQGKSRKQKSDPVSAGVSGNPEETGFSFRVIQWNLLSQALGTARDSFAMCPPEALDWEHRRHRLLEEILVHDGDILCFQEVDHFNFLAKHLERLGYKGSFVPKPDSPCIYIPENNGPDGCAIFYRTSKFELISEHTRVIEVWGVQSNQVCLISTLTLLCGLVLAGKRTLDTYSRSAANIERTREITNVSFFATALGTARDSFAMCPPEALDWEHRRHRLLEEILVHDGDILCFQEVDHFNFLAKHLERLGYKGSFVPKPDSPCIYIPENNGPDGCAIFYRTSKFELISEHTRVIEVWGVQSNQVIMATTLRCIPTSREICVATTHLKAKDGALLATIRHQEGLDVLSFLRQVADGRPIIVTGDFNAAPTEPVYAVMTGTSLRSAYATCTGSEPDYTTWKVRESSMAENAEHEETVSTLDYVFHSKRSLQVDAVLGFPAGEEMGPERLPSLKYASDHLSLACDFRLSTRGHSDELDDEVNDDEEGSENPEAGPGQFVPPYSAFKRQQSRQ
ncbi:unnamed protein product [Notodromas monacha]|uniref:Nocturnin n=1 Tax=Notodromas monacha TaxID=399045 RepID=A0A7R9BH28_9CRUS|nr:unnamed protein product [Notodromas monacha]CAG0915343.1 unnamed protein product [Notodromas monacha]